MGEGAGQGGGITFLAWKEVHRRSNSEWYAGASFRCFERRPQGTPVLPLRVDRETPRQATQKYTQQ